MLVLEGFTRTVSLVFTPDGKRLVVGQGAGPLDAWALPDGNRVQLLDRDEGANPILAVHPSGQCAYVVSKQTLLHVPLNGQPARRLIAAGDVLISPSGDRIVASSARDPARARKLMGFRCDPDGSPRGDWVANAEWEVEQHSDNQTISSETLCGFVGSGDQFVTAYHNALLIRDTATGGLQATVRYPSYYISAYAVSADGRRLAVMGYDKLYLWDTTTWGKPTRVSGLNRRIRSMAFHPTRPLLVAIQAAQTLVKFLNADTGKPVAKFNWKLGEMSSVAFSPDGTLAAAGSASGKIVVWDVDE